jgi:alkylhydroperoxidase family enzyme
VRLEVLNRNYSFDKKLLFRLIELFSRNPLPDAAKFAFFRPEFYGAAMRRLTHVVMRGDSAWSVGDRELMAAVVSQSLESPFCIGAHSATAALAYNDGAKVSAVLSNVDTAPIAEPLRVTLRILQKLAREHQVAPADFGQALLAGVTRRQLEEALAVCFAFNVTARLANAFDFKVLNREGFAAGAKFLLSRGYR